MDKDLEATPASWRRYPEWSRPLGVAALAGAVLALPLCVGIVLAVAAEYSSSFRAHVAPLWDATPVSDRVASLFATGVVLTLVALIVSLAVVWFNPTPRRAPRAAHRALVVSLLNLAFLMAAVLGEWAYIVSDFAHLE